MCVLQDSNLHSSIWRNCCMCLNGGGGQNRTDICGFRDHGPSLWTNPHYKKWAKQELNLRFLWSATRWVTTLRQPILAFVCPKRQASFRFVSWTSPGRGRGIRTLTERILSPVPLPLGYAPIFERRIGDRAPPLGLVRPIMFAHSYLRQSITVVLNLY